MPVSSFECSHRFSGTSMARYSAAATFEARNPHWLGCKSFHHRNRELCGNFSLLSTPKYFADMHTTSQPAAGGRRQGGGAVVKDEQTTTMPRAGCFCFQCCVARQHKVDDGGGGDDDDTDAPMQLCNLWENYTLRIVKVLHKYLQNICNFGIFAASFIFGEGMNMCGTECD